MTPIPSPLRARANVSSLTEAEANRLVHAFGALITSSSPARNYDRWVRTHSRYGSHQSELFLVWHRAFLMEFEDALRSACGDDELTVPYWDWTSQPSVPPLLERAPLAVPRYTDEQRQRLGHVLPTAADIGEILELRAFHFFGGSGCDGPAGPGSLELSHGLVHSWVGPAMYRLSTSVEDPIFWLVHSNVDRLWAEWQERHDTRLSCPGHALPGMLGTWTAADVLDIRSERLGYEYVGAPPAPAPDRPGAVRPFGGADAPRVVLRIDNLRLTGNGEGPAALLVNIGDDGDPIARISLFGFTHEADEAEATSTKAYDMDGHHADTVNIELDVTRQVEADRVKMARLRTSLVKGTDGAVRTVTWDRLELRLVRAES